MSDTIYTPGDRIKYAGEDATITGFHSRWYGDVVDLELDNGTTVSGLNVLNID